MPDTLKARDPRDVEEAVRWAVSEDKRLEVVGQGSKRGIGRPSQTDLTLDLSNQNVPPGVAPAAAVRELGQRLPANVECECFAGQVRVRAEEVRQVLLDVFELPIEAEQQINQPRPVVGPVRVTIGPEQKVEGPHPRH